MIDLKYNDLISKNNELENKEGVQYNISILSNIMVHQAKDICEYSLRVEAINANVVLGDYDNIIQDSLKLNQNNAVIIFCEIYNLIDGLQYKYDLLSDKEFDDLIIKSKYEIDIIFNNLQNTPLVLFNKFSSLIFEQYALHSTRLSELSNILNDYIQEHVTNNIKIIDIDKIIAKISIDKAIDLRYYYSSKTLYSIDFYKEYFTYVKPIFISLNGKSKKALIFDCDNTLWKGILGEDGIENIKMFQEIQYLAVALAKKGVIIGLCSKNNPQDVDNVLETHKDMILKDKDIVIKKVNWNDKASNLREIAKELNIGLDSLVFVDDSNFEVNLIQQELPLVKVFQVPTKNHEYIMMMRNMSNLFYNPTQTKEDVEKVKMYKAQIQRADSKKEIGDIEGYLKSLELKVTTYIDDISKLSRISQMTQKTNQFNLTTKRYTEQDIENFIHDKNKIVIAIGVHDKFGDNGIVGLSILDITDNNVKIDTLLMSCRVLGRNIEYKFMDIIIETVKKFQIITIDGLYSKTLKNGQVSDLFDRYGFEVTSKENDNCNYQLKIKNYQDKKLDYIGVIDGK